MLIFVALLVCIGGVGFYLVRPQAVRQQCPSSYVTEQERAEAFISFAKALPTSTTPYDFFAARIDFYIANGCVSELQKYGYDGRPIDVRVRAVLISSMADSLSK